MRLVVWSLALAASLLPWAARGQDETESPPPTVITIRPAASPVPALKYSLLPKPDEQIPGNAAIFYHRAIEQLIESARAPYFQDPTAQEITQRKRCRRGRAKPLADPAAGDAPPRGLRKHLERHRFSLHEIELGARREFCDWEFQRRDEGIQHDLRGLAGDAGAGSPAGPQDPAGNRRGTDRLRDPLAPDRTGHGATCRQSVELLDSNAHFRRDHQPDAGVLEELIQAPGAPNLYWALANLPRPFLDLTSPMEGEKHLLEKEFPQLKTIDAGTLEPRAGPGVLG